MAFDVRSLFRFCNREISAFAAQHADERFYAFAIDGPLLCLNSEERFTEVWANHVDQWGPEYTPIKSWQDLDRNEQRSAKIKVLKYAQPRGLDHSDEAVRVEVINRYRQENGQKSLDELRGNTGDWAYQGFAKMPEPSFDMAAYDQHYGMSDALQLSSDYAKAMDSLIEHLLNFNCFSCCKRTADFSVTRVEHNY